jgi:hypothetical protein
MLRYPWPVLPKHGPAGLTQLHRFGASCTRRREGARRFRSSTTLLECVPVRTTGNALNMTSPFPSIGPDPPPSDVLLAIYLNDHAAGATVGRELSRRSAASNRGTPYEPFLSRLAGEIAEDRRSLLAIMDALGVRVDRFKAAAAWGGEKLGRLKLNGQLRGYSPLSRIIELEGLLLGVHGKRALWITLGELAGDRPGLVADELHGLRQRAESQLEGLETHRTRAIAEALGPNG